MAATEEVEHAVALLRTLSEQSMERLKELTQVHLDMDPPSTEIGATEDECVYRLRKVLFHIVSVSGWTIDFDVMHVVAPELRAANEQLDQIVKMKKWKYITDILDGSGLDLLRPSDKHSKMQKSMMSSYIHPTTLRLVMPGELGGLGNVGRVKYYFNMALSLGELVAKYAICLAPLSQIRGSKKEPDLADIIQGLGKELDTTFSHINVRNIFDLGRHEESTEAGGA